MIKTKTTRYILRAILFLVIISMIFTTTWWLPLLLAVALSLVFDKYYEILLIGFVSDMVSTNPALDTSFLSYKSWPIGLLLSLAIFILSHHMHTNQILSKRQ